jgi:hypothetical protein
VARMQQRQLTIGVKHERRGSRVCFLRIVCRCR